MLGGAPMSGASPEYHFGGPGGTNWLWVLFEEEDGSSWCASFCGGDSNYSDVLFLGSGRNVFVVSRGRGYWLDAEQKRLLNTTECDIITTAIAVPDGRLVVFADFTDLFATGVDGLLWRSRQVALDGVRLLRATSDRVWGDARGYRVGQDEWQPFEVDLATGTVRGGAWDLEPR
jgi:hypothetical protein